LSRGSAELAPWIGGALVVLVAWAGRYQVWRACQGAARSPVAVSQWSGPLQPLVIRTAGERIAERFVTAIALGEFVAGQRLPSERRLSDLLQVSRATGSVRRWRAWVRPGVCGRAAAAVAARSWQRSGGRRSRPR